MVVSSHYSQFVDLLTDWGNQNQRRFPWREETNPFKILIAEVLLQRSRAKTVTKIYTELFSRWPDAKSLSMASEETIRGVIEPLGLVKRASTIHNLALLVSKVGSTLSSYEEILNLPGVGEYMSGATANTTLGESKPIVDSVSARVYRRFFGLYPYTSSKNVDSELISLVNRILTYDIHYHLNWYVLDLAAEICLPKIPRCHRCPLSEACIYLQASHQKRVAELFAGVGGFRLGLEKSGWQVVFSNQWEPSAKHQYASEVYIRRFGERHHVCEDIEKVLDEFEFEGRESPDFELLVGGFPCQDYSVARTLSQATGIQGKKGVLWWQIYRLLSMKRPHFLFLENVDRLLSSPATQKGRDFAIMLACLSGLGYLVEWRVINAADYGFPQKRRRLFIIGSLTSNNHVIRNPINLLVHNGVFSRAFPVRLLEDQPTLSLNGLTLPDFSLDDDIKLISDHFGKGGIRTPFFNAGVMHNRQIWTRKVIPKYYQKRRVLKDIILPEDKVDTTYYVADGQIEKWRYLKGAKKEHRIHKASGFEYSYNEGAIPFPDNLEEPSRTILTGEGGSTPSRFKHIILTPTGRYRRLTPIELERLNGFPDDWTAGIPDTRRAFLMGNALVVGIIERIGQVLADVLCEAIVIQTDNP
ncbi:MAG TPA: DNA (cytosine-5-)-methyltransferase [Dehalococcoidia bacterium]|nr:DNA (cytosine-5-)-methyltransferase [Dehalococcoidia bacterium]